MWQENICGIETRRKIALHICGATVSGKDQPQAPDAETNSSTALDAQPSSAAEAIPAEPTADVGTVVIKEDAAGVPQPIRSPVEPLPEDPLAEQPSTAEEQSAPAPPIAEGEGPAAHEPAVPEVAELSAAVAGATQPAVTLSLVDVWGFKRKQATWAI